MSWFGDSWDSFSDWFTGASSSNRQYRYQASLDAATRGFEHKEAELAYERQKDFFDYQSRYNTPVNQMARLRAAGLNPNLVYGNGAMATQGSTGMVSMGHSTGPGTATGGVSNAGAASGLLGVLAGLGGQIVHGVKEMADAQETKASTAGKELDNQDKVLHQIFGDGTLYKTARMMVGVKNAKNFFPEQYSFIKSKLDASYDWLGKQADKVSSWFKPGDKSVGVINLGTRSGTPNDPALKAETPVKFNRYHGFGGW